MIRQMSLWSPTARRFFKRRTRLKAMHTACQRRSSVIHHENNQWNMSPGSVVAPLQDVQGAGQNCSARVHGLLARDGVLRNCRGC